MKNNKKALIEVYKEINSRIKTIDFNLLYPGFKPVDFALYNDKIVVFKDKVIPYDSRFVGNTAIFFEDSYLAIWKLDSIYVHYNILTSKIVHEMFHAWQFSNNELRFPNEFLGLRYLYEKFNLGLKFDETKYLLKAYEDDDFTALETFISLRNKRKKDYVNEISYEEGIETIEGMARYVELKALKELDFSEFQKSYEQLKSLIKNLNNYIPIRVISYEIGALMMLVKDKYNLSIEHQIGIETRNIYNILFDDIEYKDIPYEDNNLNFSFLEEYYQKMTLRISSVLSSNPKIISCDSVIGFDPLNSFQIGKYIYFRHFVMIKIGHQQIFVHNESVGETDDLNRVFVIYEKKTI
ncbi:MAG: hypothetical protein WC152_07835 [Candidatus Izemoplasmatales bacterium]